MSNSRRAEVRVFFADGSKGRLDVEAVCRAYGASVLRRCRAILRDHDEAEDASQEVFVMVLRKGKQFRGDADVATWLYRVTTNVCLNRIRGKKRRGDREVDYDGSAFGDPPDPHDQAVARQTLLNRWRELDDLNQQLFVYTYLDDLTQEEVARLTGKSRRTVGKRVKQIRALFAEEDSSGGTSANRV